jgi:hypothetical protein
MLEALIDTGNELRDPLSQKPVIIVEYPILKKILPLIFNDGLIDLGQRILPGFWNNPQVLHGIQKSVLFL